jgi:2,3-bisphosphoglycerate-independent phosphoglycerate mutase
MRRSTLSTRYAILVGDGMADFPIPELGNKTVIEYAATPNMDRVAALGSVGLVKTIPDGIPPGSDVANMSLLGYDPAKYYTGRAPIEAASMGVKLGPRDTAFRCNLVTLENGRMADYSAGHIETADAHAIIADLSAALGTDRVKFTPGVSYRHLLVLSEFAEGKLDCTPPHDISGQEYAPHLPKGAGAGMLLDLMTRARGILAQSPTNRARIAAGKKPATDIWLWGQGTSVTFPSMKERYGLSGSVVSAVDLVRGIGILAGLRARIVPGATGYLGTNYAGKVHAARQALEEEGFVFVHVEAPDETGHEGSVEKKVQAVEEFDRHVVGEVLKMRGAMPDLRIMVLPDHATPIATKTHHAMPVPFAVCGRGVSVDGGTTYSERAAEGRRQYAGRTLFEEFIKGTF